MAEKETGVAWPLSEDARPQAAKGDAVQLAATTPIQMWTTEKMERCGEKRPSEMWKCRNMSGMPRQVGQEQDGEPCAGWGW